MEKHIIHWSDGEVNWSMLIEAGKVEIKTTEATKEDAAKALSAEWSKLMGFATDSFTRTNEPK